MEIIDDELNSSAEVTGPEHNRFIDRLNPRLVNVLTVVGFGIPVAGYFWLLHLYSVNVVVGDQWDDVTIIGSSFKHLFNWNSLWALHNENRIFFPNLIVLLLAHTAHFNIQLEEYFSGVMLVLATAFLIWAHKRRSRSTPWLYYCPVALLAFSIVQYENTLWGFQMAWYLVMLALATAIVLLDRPTLTWMVLVAAIAAGVVGSFSSLQGLLIWPAGLVLLYHRRRRLSYAFTWIAAAAVAVVLYFHNFNANAAPYHNYAWQHPILAAKFFLFVVGDVVGLPITQPRSGNNGVLLLGGVIVVLAVGTVVAYGIRRDESGGSPIGVGLICVGLLFAAIVTDGRIIFGYQSASLSRYTTFDLLIPIGIYLALLGRPTIGVGHQQPGIHSVGEQPAVGQLAPTDNRFRRRIKRSWLPMARWAIAIVIALQIGLGLHYGAKGARANYAYKSEAAHVLRNINHESNSDVVYYLYPFSSPSSIRKQARKQARILEIHHLSLFSGVTSP